MSVVRIKPDMTTTSEGAPTRASQPINDTMNLKPGILADPHMIIFSGRIVKLILAGGVNGREEQNYSTLDH
jgi:hypothetical protein